MPAPFAIPLIITSFLPILIFSTPTLIFLSVVIIAFSALISPFSESSLTSFGTDSSIKSIGSLFPIIPVEETSTLSNLRFRYLHTALIILLASLVPYQPVQQLAFPLFIMTALVGFPFFKIPFETRSGAALSLFFVKTPTASHPVFEYIRARSFLNLFIPQ